MIRACSEATIAASIAANQHPDVMGDYAADREGAITTIGNPPRKRTLATSLGGYGCLALLKESVRSGHRTQIRKAAVAQWLHMTRKIAIDYRISCTQPK